jgi:hypothetical protein
MLRLAGGVESPDPGRMTKAAAALIRELREAGHLPRGRRVAILVPPHGVAVLNPHADRRLALAGEPGRSRKPFR